jgi:hypothetical protein
MGRSGAAFLPELENLFLADLKIGHYIRFLQFIQC